MTTPRVDHLVVRRTARYLTLGTDRDPTEVWFALHGYGQLAADFARAMEPVAGDGRLVVVPEGLSRFYLESPGGTHANARVGATWMTREDRLHEIADYVGYLDTLAESIVSTRGRTRLRLTVLGFSQGVATVARWVAQGRTRPDHLILWASALPPEIDAGAGAEALAAVPRISVVVGAGDADAQRALPRERERMARLGIEHALIGFAGGHHLDADTLRILSRPPEPR